MLMYEKYIDECAILVMSCDNNKGVLDIFFDYFNRNWGQCPFHVYLGMEKLKPVYENVSILCSDKESFAGRLKEFIKYINKKYILLILDDFILEEKVDDDIYYFYELMLKDCMLANISLTYVIGQATAYNKCVVKKKYNTSYMLNLQTSFWNARILESLLKDGENAWQTELYGSIRARRYKNYAFCNLAKDVKMPYKYNNGWLIVKGAWNGNGIVRLKLYSYVQSFMDGKKILYDNFGRISRVASLKLRVGMFIRKCLSRINIYI